MPLLRVDGDLDLIAHHTIDAPSRADSNRQGIFPGYALFCVRQLSAGFGPIRICSIATTAVAAGPGSSSTRPMKKNAPKCCCQKECSRCFLLAMFPSSRRRRKPRRFPSWHTGWFFHGQRERERGRRPTGSRNRDELICAVGIARLVVCLDRLAPCRHMPRAVVQLFREKETQPPAISIAEPVRCVARCVPAARQCQTFSNHATRRS